MDSIKQLIASKYERSNYRNHPRAVARNRRREVAAILPKLADFRRKNEPVETDGMNVEDAALFLTEQGIPTTRATLYNQVYKNTIPYKKFGRRTVFSRRELLAWIESRTVHSEDRRTAAALRIAESANRK